MNKTAEKSYPTVDPVYIGKYFLSYRGYKDQKVLVVEVDGFEPTTPCLQSRCSPN